MRANWSGVLVGGAVFAAVASGIGGGSARAQAVGGGTPVPSYGAPAVPSAPRPLPPGAFPAAGTPGVGVGVGVTPARVAAAPAPTAAVGDGAALTSTAPAGVVAGPGASSGSALGTPIGAAPADGHPSYFRSELPPSPPTRLERMRQRVRDVLRKNHAGEGTEDHRYIDPSTGKTNLPISKPWLTPAR